MKLQRFIFPDGRCWLLCLGLVGAWSSPAAADELEAVVTGSLTVAPDRVLVAESVVATFHDFAVQVSPAQLGEQYLTQWQAGSPQVTHVWGEPFTPAAPATPPGPTGSSVATGAFADMGIHTVMVTVTVTGVLEYWPDNPEAGDEPLLRSVQTSATFERSLTVSDQTLRLTVKRGTQDQWGDAPLRIAPGGKSTPVHRADLRLTFAPPLDGATPVWVRLLPAAGVGFQPQKWWWPSSASNAKLSVMEQVFEAGGTLAALDLLPPAGTTELLGTLVSSNMEDTVTVEARLPQTQLTAQGQISFELDPIAMNSQVPGLQAGVWKTWRATVTVDEDPVPGHELRFVIGRVQLADESEPVLALGNSEESSVSASAFVVIDGPLLITSYGSGTTDAAGQAEVKTKVVDPSVHDFWLYTFDLDVAADDW